MSEFASFDPSERYGRLQRSYIATGAEAVLDELTDIGRLLAVAGIPVESVLEAHGAVLAEELAKAAPPRHDDLVQASTVCLSQVMVAWRMAAEGLVDSTNGALPEPAASPVFLLFDRDGGLSGDPVATSLQGKLAALGVSARLPEVGEALAQRRLMTFDVHPASGSEQVLHAVLCPFHDGSGVLCIHDVSARRAAAEALFQRRKLASLGQLAGGIAHEINNLLQPILSAAQFIGEDHADDSELMDNVHVILDSARLAANVVRDVLTFARRGASQLVPMDLAQAVTREMAAILRTVPAAVEVDIQVQAAPVIRANACEFAQVLRNLVGNAIEATQGGGRVAISVALVEVDVLQSVRLLLPAGGYARLSVADDGPGVPDEVARRIFEPFFTTKDIGKGTGLGLAIVRGIVQGWGGTIALRPDVVAGAVFDIFIPVTDMAVATPADAAEAQGGHPGMSVTVVDDDACVREMIARVLERAGYDVRAFASAEEALGHFDAGSGPALLLSDWMMPGMDGFAFVKEVRRRQPHLPVLILTGGGDGSQGEELRQRAAGLGVAEVLFKPVSGSQLLAAVRRCLEGHAPSGREQEDMPGQRQVENADD